MKQLHPIDEKIGTISHFHRFQNLHYFCFLQVPRENPDISDLQGKEGQDRTAKDIPMFAKGGAEAVREQKVPEDDEREQGGMSSIVSSSEGVPG